VTDPLNRASVITVPSAARKLDRVTCGRGGGEGDGDAWLVRLAAAWLPEPAAAAFAPAPQPAEQAASSTIRPVHIGQRAHRI
jgi:hypothetical protein